jgi:release factor glutamine methyltransferase
MGTIYQPAEDSYLMSRILKEQIPRLLENNPDLKFLEIGAGSGIHLEAASSIGIKKDNIFSSDINLSSVNHCTSLGYNCVYSDLFENIHGKYNLIIFNPPYLPEDSREPQDSRLATTGGNKGDEIILRFLNEAKDYLEEEGKIFLITSNLAEQIDFEELGYNAEELGCEKMFFERLCIWELTSSLYN